MFEDSWQAMVEVAYHGHRSAPPAKLCQQVCNAWAKAPGPGRAIGIEDGAREGAKYLKLFGLEGKVSLAEVELSNAVPALKNGQIDGFVTAGSFPAPNVIEAAASAGATVISLNDEQVRVSKRTRLVIPAGTYAGQTSDVVTTSLPVVAFTTTDMDEETAYQLTKTYWENKTALGAAAKWWDGVSLDMLENILTDIHPGAKRYYQEAGANLAAHH